MPPSKKVLAVMTEHVDCCTYVYKDKLSLSPIGGIEANLKQEAESENGTVTEMTEAAAKKFMDRYDKRIKKEKAAAAKKAKAEAKKAAAKAAKEREKKDGGRKANGNE